jgi:murein DD-endopeptidase MepM/ murein hydrolase activator NlpD
VSDQGKKSWTIVVLSETQAQMRQFRIQRNWLFIGLGALGVMFILVFVFGISTWSLSTEIEDTAALKARVNELEQTNERIQKLAEELGDLRQFEKQLRRGLLQTGGGRVQVADSLLDPNLIELEEEPETMAEIADYAANADRPIEGTLPSELPTHEPVRGYVTRAFETRSALADPAHYGTDYAAREGTTVEAAADGIVVFAGWSYPYGNLLVLSHKLGYHTFYGHNLSLLVEPGEQVTQAQPIALVGNSGRSSAPHLHFEIWKEGHRVDPELFLVGARTGS